MVREDVTEWIDLRQKLRLDFTKCSRYPAPARLGIFVITLLLLWLPLAGPIYWFWGAGNNISIVTILILYGEFIVLLRLWGQRVHQQTQPLKNHGLVINRKNGLDLFKGIIIGLLSLLCLFLFEGGLGWLNWQSPTQFLPKVMLEGLIVALGVGLAEELMFRGWLVDELQWDYGSKASVWLSSTLYALLHFVKPFAEIWRTSPSFPGLLLLGLTLGWTRIVRKGRLGFPIGLHAGLVWGYYVTNVGDLVLYTGQVPVWVTGIDRNPLAGSMGLLFLGLMALGLRRVPV